MSLPVLTIEILVEEARRFASNMNMMRHERIVNITDGKAIGTYVEQEFKNKISVKYDVSIGNSAKGIDLPSDNINTDIKVTSIAQPQSSSPFKAARQKIFGLGYNLIVFVYEKNDLFEYNLSFKNVIFVRQHRTADFTITRRISEIIKDDGNIEDIVAYLNDRHLPADEIELINIAEKCLKDGVNQGYLTISNALQWRIQYKRIITLGDTVEGVERII